MIYSVLTYSRNLGDFSFDLAQLHGFGLKGIRLIYKGKTEDEFNARISEIQAHLREHKLELDLLIDLPGNKPQVGDLGKGVDVQAGLEYHLTNHPVESASLIIPTVSFFDNENFPRLAKGDIISIADDELNLLVKDIQETVVTCEALNSFHLTSNRSMSVKDKPFAFVANSEKDVHFVQHMLQPQANIKLLVSFTRSAEDILVLKRLQPDVEVIPKIETILDDTALAGILDCCETIILGRGDLSTAHRPNEIFRFQQKMIDLCKKHKKRLIVGTGLLAGIGEKQAATIADVMDYSYLRSEGIDSFLIAGSNAHNQPLKTLEFIRDFES